MPTYRASIASLAILSALAAMNLPVRAANEGDPSASDRAVPQSMIPQQRPTHASKRWNWQAGAPSQWVRAKQNAIVHGTQDGRQDDPTLEQRPMPSRGQEHSRAVGPQGWRGDSAEAMSPLQNSVPYRQRNAVGPQGWRPEMHDDADDPNAGRDVERTRRARGMR